MVANGSARSLSSFPDLLFTDHQQKTTMKFHLSMLKLSACILAIGSFQLHADSVTATYSAQDDGSALADSTGVFLGTGALVRLGYFDASVDFATMNTSLTTLNSHFTELAHIQVGFFDGETVYDNTANPPTRTDGTNLGLDGYFAGKVTLDPVFRGLSSTRMYMWAFDTSALSTATAHAIFSDDAWLLGTTGATLFELGTADPLDKNDIYYSVRGVGLSTPAFPDADKNVVNMLIPVPEPSTSAAALAFGLGLIFHRRRSVA